ncbi:MAG: hypothetical protein ACRDNM_01650 [Gaiellaceae bacterium]
MRYAVLWSKGAGVPAIGRLELSAGLIRLGDTEVAYDEIATARIDRSPQVRLAGRPTLVLEHRDGSILRVASFDGVGSLHELAERLEAAVRAG